VTAAGRLETAEEALRGAAEVLAADGYVLRVRALTGTSATIAIIATEDACAECLVPKPVLAGMLRSALPDEVGIETIEVLYPNDVTEETTSPGGAPMMLSEGGGT
jgi:hypothetical protein